jgi:hypothetical protein
MTENKTNIFQALIKREPHFLDKPLADLLPLRFMGEVAVNAYKGLIKRLDDLPLSLEEKESRLKDGQDAGKALLMIEARIGQLLPSAEEAEKSKAGLTGKERQRRPEGVTLAQAHRARQIATHPHEVAEVIHEAEENEDIPTKTAVLNKIAYKRELARKKGAQEKSQLEMAADAFGYYSKLVEVLNILPTKPPKELKEKDFIKIKALALLIIKRLEVFKDEKNEKVLSGSSRRLSP